MEPTFDQIYSEQEVEWLAKEFPLLREQKLGCQTYLDNAGASLYCQSQMDAVHKDLTSNLFSNPHTHFGEAVLGQNDINSRVLEARQLVLRFFNTDSSQYQVIFTNNATGSMKIVAENFPWQSGSTFAYLDECHTSAVGLRQYAIKENARCQVFSQNDVEKQLRMDQSLGKKLFVFPGMSNFCGTKYPTEKWIEIAHECGWCVILDAASLVATSPLDLSKISPDFVAISFYKIFGYPTGLGALLIRKQSSSILKKNYFGGGTVQMNLVRENQHVGKSGESNFEDGTLPFLSITSIRFGLEIVNSIGMDKISRHTFHLAKYLVHHLKMLKHENGKPVVKVYAWNDEPAVDVTNQGGIVNFNLVKPDGSLYGFSEFQKVSLHNNLVVRVGCFCNIGACQRHLGLTDADVLSNYAAGHVCGDNMDLINSRPTGSIRVSFGYYSIRADADKVVDIVRKNYVHSSSQNEKTQTNGEDLAATPYISGLYLYPVKSCAGIKVQSWPLASGSLLYDRKFLIMHGGSPLTQKSFPALCLLRPFINLQTKILTLSFQDVEPISIDIIDDQQGREEEEDILIEKDNHILRESEKGDSFSLCFGKVCGDKIEGLDCGHRVSQWLENITGLTGLKLVQLLTRTHRPSKVEKGLSKLQTLANEAQFLIINKSSCEALQVETDDPDWLVEQFRGNIIVSGAKAFEEEEWKNLEVLGSSSVNFSATSLCTRCTVIGLNQKTGEKVDKDRDPISALTRRSGQRFKFGVLAFLQENFRSEHLQQESRNISVNMELNITRK